MESETDFNAVKIHSAQIICKENEDDAESMSFVQNIPINSYEITQISGSTSDVGMVTPVEVLRKDIRCDKPNIEWQTPARKLKMFKNKFSLRSHTITPDLSSPNLDITEISAQCKNQKSLKPLVKKKRLLFPGDSPRENIKELNTSRNEIYLDNSSQSLFERKFRDASSKFFGDGNAGNITKLRCQKLNKCISVPDGPVREESHEKYTFSESDLDGNCSKGKFVSERIEREAEVVSEPIGRKTPNSWTENLEKVVVPSGFAVRERSSHDSLTNLQKISPSLVQKPRKMPKFDSAIVEERLRNSHIAPNFGLKRKSDKISDYNDVYDINHNIIPNCCSHPQSKLDKRDDTFFSYSHHKDKIVTPSRSIRKINSSCAGKENVPKSSSSIKKTVIEADGTPASSPFPLISCWAPMKKKRIRLGILSPSCRRNLLRPFDELSLDCPVLETPPCSPSRCDLLPLY